MKPDISSRPLYYYISTRAGCDPCRTIYLCAPEPFCRTAEGVESFAQSSGWKDIVELQSAILVAPVAPEGWEAQPSTLLRELYQETRNRFLSPSGEAIWGRMGSLWCWETLLYAAGYGEGAAFVGRTLVSCPNVLAAAAMVGGAPADFRDGDAPSSHWLTARVSPDYQVKNRDIPVCAWLFTRQEADVAQAADYFRSCGGMVEVRTGSTQPTPALSQEIMSQCFARTIRWKNSPDGTLTRANSRESFYHDPRFIRRTVKLEGTTYGFSLHLPQGMTPDQVRGLPLVFSVHGRGEPVWLFAEKNGWDLLADQTREFVLACPDSPGNIWFSPRDARAFPRMIQAIQDEFHTDPARVYLTGFSNGGMITREVGLRYPQLFAAISVWNAPKSDTFFMMQADQGALLDHPLPQMQALVQQFLHSGLDLPCAFFYGDQDGASRPTENPLMELFLKSNGCRAVRLPDHPTGWQPDAVWDGTNHYTPDAGYQQGDRFTTYCFCTRDGLPKVTSTIMKNMPHGAIHEESKAAWAFLRSFRRTL